MIAHKDLSILTYEQLKADIIAGKLEPGSKLVQEKLAAEMGVSRMPLHRAFQMLESEMLVEAKPRRGFYVRDVSLKTLIEAFECREVLEGLAARRIAESEDCKNVANRLWEYFEPFDNTLNIDRESYQKADQGFHNALTASAGSEVLKRLNTFSHFLKQSYVFGLVRNPKETLEEHRAIVKAIAEGNGELAEKEIRKHASQSIEIIKQQNNLE